ncbi:MAG: single-stranded DNA-binding protein [Cyanobacteria bacterium P01_A01_bin.45]
MNNCILMADIVQPPQLRYTTDNLEVAEMMVQFPSLREGEPPSNLKVIGWGNTAKEIQQNYHQGDRVILEGRLGMHTFERPEGFKEKRTELTVQRIYRLDAGMNFNSSAAMNTIPADTISPSTMPSADTSFSQPVAPLSPTTPATAIPAALPNPTTSNTNTFSEDNSSPVSPTRHFEPSTYPAMVEEEEDMTEDEIPF